MGAFYPITLQPHSGAVALILHHHLKNPEIKNYNVRMSSPRSKSYQIIMAGRTSDEYIFRTGKDWPCYSRIRVNPTGTEFVLRHDHTWVQERFRIEGNRLYMGEVTTEAGMRIEFEGDFITEKNLRINENFRMPDSGKAIYTDRHYEIDSCW